MSDQFGLQGIDELTAKFASITNDAKYKGGRFALRRAANIVAKAAKQGAQRVDDPATGRSLTILQCGLAIRLKKAELMFRVGVKHGSLLKVGGDVSAKHPHWRLLIWSEDAGSRLCRHLKATSDRQQMNLLLSIKNQLTVQLKKASKATA